MPWPEVSAVSARSEFVDFAHREGANVSRLCERFGISRKTGYKWLSRYKQDACCDFEDRSRCPGTIPHRTSKAVEDKIIALRDKHPAWGARKLSRRMKDLGEREVPALSTITQILRRRGRLSSEPCPERQPWQRFEHPVPNALWQMDFKGPFPLRRGACHPLTVLDDHSRFSVGLVACPNQRGDTVQPALTQIFRTYGLPDSILSDNGAPWWGTKGGTVSRISIWLIRLGIRLTRCRPYHPQTQGKEERFHRTLNAEVIAYRAWSTLPQCQGAFDHWRDVYNFERPHEALALNVPATRYEPSHRAFPDALPPIEYGPGDHVRKVGANGYFRYQGHNLRVSNALRGLHVAVRPTPKDGCVDVFFCNHRVGAFDLREYDDT